MSDDNIVQMAGKTGNGLLGSPEQALQEALSDIGKHGAFEKGKKLLILCLDETDGQYDVSFIQAGMKMSECISLCEIAKELFKSEMNY